MEFMAGWRLRSGSEARKKGFHSTQRVKSSVYLTKRNPLLHPPRQYDITPPHFCLGASTSKPLAPAVAFGVERNLPFFPDSPDRAPPFTSPPTPRSPIQFYAPLGIYDALSLEWCMPFEAW